MQFKRGDRVVFPKQAIAPKTVGIVEVVHPEEGPAGSLEVRMNQVNGHHVGSPAIRGRVDAARFQLATPDEISDSHETYGFPPER